MAVSYDLFDQRLYRGGTLNYLRSPTSADLLASYAGMPLAKPGKPGGRAAGKL
jgi:hypothetical protein